MSILFAKKNHETKVLFSCFIAVFLVLTASLPVFADGPTRTSSDTTEPMKVPGWSPVHQLKYNPQFKHFAYVNSHAKKGGTLKIAALGSYDSLNTLRWPGRAPGDGRQQFNMRYLLLDSLIEASADESAGYYGLLAETIDVADDFSSVRFKIRSQARWHDGKPILARDVAFTFATLLKQGAPYYRQTLRGIQVVTENDRTVLFRARQPGDRNFVATIGTIPIHPEHFWKKNDVEKSSMTLPLGSGPYRVEKAESGKSIVLKRVADYWAKDHPVNVGRYNFDQLEIDWFRDGGVALEAFKAGEYDMRLEGDAVRWSTGYEGPALARGQFRKREFMQKKPGQIMALVFNLRRKPFDDVRVRRAINLAYNFKWTNQNLFSNLYEPVHSVFGRTELAAKDAAGKGERSILEPFVKDLPDGILSHTVPMKGRAFRNERAALKEADLLLARAGYIVKDGVRLSRETGKPLTIRIIHYNTRLERVLAQLAGNLKRLGIMLDYRAIEPALATRQILAHEFDMATLSQWSPSLLPGKGERLLWGSALADKKHSYALAGVKDPALDAAIEMMNTARDTKSLRAGARAFDRVFSWRQYVVPLYRTNSLWMAHKKGLKGPDMSAMITPRFLDIWWWSRHQKSAMSLQ